MKNILILLSFVLFIQGCAVHVPSGSFAVDIPQMLVTEKIAGDLLDYLSEDYPSGHTEIALLHPQRDNDFSSRLEAALRRRGYTLSQNSPLTLLYTLDMLESSEYYLQVTFDDFSIGRMYDISGNPRSNWTKKVAE